MVVIPHPSMVGATLAAARRSRFRMTDKKPPSFDDPGSATAVKPLALSPRFDPITHIYLPLHGIELSLEFQFEDTVR